MGDTKPNPHTSEKLSFTDRVSSSLRIVWQVCRSHKEVLFATVYLGVLFIFAGLLEGVGVLTIVPFASAIGKAPVSEDNGFVSSVLEFLPFEPTIWSLGAVILGCVVLRSLIQIHAYVYGRSVQANTENKFRRQLIDALMNSQYALLGQQELGRTTNVIIAETRNIGLMVSLFARVLDKVFKVVIYGVILFALSWKLSLASMATAVVIYIFLRPAQKYSNRMGRRVAELNAQLLGQVSSVVLGFRAIKSLAAEHHEASKLNDTMIDLKDRQVGLARVDILAQSIFEPAVVVLALTSLVVFSEMSLVTFGVFLLSLNRVYTNLRAIQALAFKIFLRTASVQVYMALRDHLVGYRFGNIHGAEDIPRVTQAISFKEVFYKYPVLSQNDPVSEFAVGPIDLDIKQGRYLGIVGRSGSGKSTLVDLMLGFLTPTKGQVAVDNKPLSEYDLSQYRRTIGYVAQEGFLVNESIAHNIAYPHTIDLNRVQRAAHRALVTEFSDSLADGLNFMIGENGSRLSGGQRQRVCLARALYNEPSVLILDEATSALDQVSENLVAKAIESLRGETTIIQISHRPEALVGVDEVVLLSRGQIAMRGTVNEVFAYQKRSHDSNLTQLQDG